jgi:DNA-binding transcriptional MerR regulator
VTLRRWELQGILKPHHKSPTGYRYYSEEQLKNYIAGKEETCKE